MSLSVIATCVLTVVHNGWDYPGYLAAAAAAAIALGAVLKDQPITVEGIIAFVVALAGCILNCVVMDKTDPKHWEPVYGGAPSLTMIVPVVAFAYLASGIFAYLCRTGGIGKDFLENQGLTDREAAALRSIFGVAATVVLAISFGLNLSNWNGAYTVALAFEALAVTVAGFWLKDLPYRMSGVALFLLLVLKVLILDLVDMPAAGRIGTLSGTALALYLGWMVYFFCAKRIQPSFYWGKDGGSARRGSY
jgi:hypothetical protein